MIETPIQIATGDLASIWEIWGPRLVYCLALTIGIWVSMLRQQKARSVFD